jgi:UDP-N-acetylglucosamine/UDP-N-acetylgalactosamine diphosphorylase
MRELKSKLAKYKQEHLLNYFDSLSSNEQKILLAEINSIDFESIQELFNSLSTKTTQKAPSFSPMSCCYQEEQSNEQKISWTEVGKKSLDNNELAFLLMAGGQGSRLGLDGPKGAFIPTGLDSELSLFGYQAKSLLKQSKNSEKPPLWLIMTSPLNQKQTKEHFLQNQYFGYQKDQILFFNQGTIPAINAAGKVLLSSKSSVALVPDGNGGCFKALQQTGLDKVLDENGIKHLFIYGVDNLLIKLPDPTFLGYHISQKNLSSNKIVKKASPTESVGVFAQVNDKPSIVEYSNLSDTERFAQDETKNLLYGQANIVMHLFDWNKLKAKLDTPLPYHKAFKKVSFIDGAGIEVKPTEPNAWKFEQFLFDIFPRLGSAHTFEVLREQEFGPIKNATGNDSPESAVKLYKAEQKRLQGSI